MDLKGLRVGTFRKLLLCNYKEVKILKLTS
jgi:hypothetical protein